MEAPDPTYTAPLSPTLAVPVLSTNKPLTPDVPEFAVLNNNDPLVDEDPYPLTKETRPPADDELTPADSTISPPVPLLPEPTTT